MNIDIKLYGEIKSPFCLCKNLHWMKREHTSDELDRRQNKIGSEINA